MKKGVWLIVSLLLIQSIFVAAQFEDQEELDKLLDEVDRELDEYDKGFFDDEFRDDDVRRERHDSPRRDPSDKFERDEREFNDHDEREMHDKREMSDEMFFFDPGQYIHNPEKYLKLCDNQEEMVDTLFADLEEMGAFKQMELQMERRCEDELRFLERRCILFDDYDEHERDYCEDMLNRDDDWQHDIFSVDEMVEECLEGTRQDLESRQEQENQEELDKILDEAEDRCKDQAEDNFEREKKYREEDNKIQEERMKEDIKFCKERQKLERDQRKEEMDQMRDEQKERCDLEKEKIKEMCSNKGSGKLGIRERMVKQGKIMCEKYVSGEDMDHMLRSIKDDERREHFSKEMKDIKKTEKSVQSLKKGGSLLDKILIALGLKNIKKDLNKAADKLGKSIESLEELKDSLNDEEAKSILETQIDSLEEERDNLYEQAGKIGEDSPSGFAIFRKDFLP